MPAIHRPAGIALLFGAFVLLLIASISTPFFRTVDIAHTSTSVQGVTEEVRYGIWGACRSVTLLGTNCQHLGHGYSTDMNLQLRFVPLSSSKIAAGVKSSWTRGLATHPVATAIVFVAFVTSIVASNQLIPIISGAIGALVTLIAIAIDIAFLLLTRHNVDDITNAATTSFGPGFWLTLVGFLITIGGIVLLFIHRRENSSWDSDSNSISLDFLKKPLARFRN